MSETLIPGYYNTKISNHDWAIYMGGERYFPAYPTKHTEPEPVKDIVKRYLVLNSSSDEYYDNDEYIDGTNKYLLTIKEAYINENDETIEFNGRAYYIWRGWNQHYDDTIPDVYGKAGKIALLTTTLEPKLPFNCFGDEKGFLIIIDSEADETEYLGYNYTFIGLVKETANGVRTYDMCNCKVRMYSYSDFSKESDSKRPNDYFQYDGETMVYNGETCYVWNRYVSNTKCDLNNEFPPQYILTNTLWINTSPFNNESQEFVACISEDSDVYDMKHSPFDRIEYFPDTVYGETITGMTETVLGKINLNVFTILSDSYGWYSRMEYNGKTIDLDGKTCFVWDCPYLGSDEGDPTKCHAHIVTNTLDIKQPFIIKDKWGEPIGYNESPEFISFLSTDDTYRTDHAEGWIRDVLERDQSKTFGEPIYKDIIVIK